MTGLDADWDDFCLHVSLVNNQRAGTSLIAGMIYTIPAVHVWMVENLLWSCGVLNGDNDPCYQIHLTSPEGDPLFWFSEYGLFFAHPDEFGFLRCSGNAYRGQSVVISFVRQW